MPAVGVQACRVTKARLMLESDMIYINTHIPLCLCLLFPIFTSPLVCVLVPQILKKVWTFPTCTTTLLLQLRVIIQKVVSDVPVLCTKLINTREGSFLSE